MNWLHYLLEANLYLVVFYTGYCLFLNKETYYTLNRAYLLLSCILSFLLPIIQIGALKPVESGVVNVVLLAPTGLKSITTEVSPVSHITYITVDNVLLYVYLLGVIVFALVLIFKIFRLIKMTRTTNALVDNKYKLIGIDGSNTAFSFFNYLFIGTKTAGSDIIIRHELVHIRQKHSADIIFMELIKIINWFNPFIYLMQVSLKTVHEYIADEQTAAHETDALSYSSFLVNNAYGLNGSSITHSFFNYNLLKKRIIMLNQKRSGSLARLKYLMAVPICAGLLCASTLGFSKTYGWVDLAPQQKAKLLAATDSGAKPQQPKVPKYMLQPPPPPTSVKDGYVGLFNYINKTINYPKEALKAERAGLVVVSINIKNDHKLSDIKILKRAADEFNDEVLKAFLSYNGSVADKPGEHKIIINFCTDYQKFAKSADAAILKQPGYDLDMIFYNDGKYPVMPPPHAPATINKKAINIPPPPPPAPPVKAPKVSKVIPAAPKDVKIAPKADGVVVTPPAPKGPFDDLYMYIAKHVRYPAVARENHFAGRIILTFNINNGKIGDLKITRGLYDVMDAEVVRVIKNYNGTLNTKSGKYSVPVSFSLVDQNDNNVGKVPDYNAPANAKNKPEANTIVVESGPTYSLNEVVIVGYVDTKK